MQKHLLSPPSVLPKFNLVFDEYDFLRLQELLKNLEELHDMLMIDHQRIINDALVDKLQEEKHDNGQWKGTIKFINRLMLTVMEGSSLYCNVNGALQKISF